MPDPKPALSPEAAAWCPACGAPCVPRSAAAGTRGFAALEPAAPGTPGRCGVCWGTGRERGPGLSPQARVFCLKWELRLVDFPEAMHDDLVALLAATRREVWLEAAEIALNNYAEHCSRYGSQGNARIAGAEIADTLRLKAKEARDKGSFLQARAAESSAGD